MTRTEACKLLGVSSSTSRSKAEVAYLEKRKKLHLQLVPGMPLATR